MRLPFLLLAVIGFVGCSAPVAPRTIQRLPYPYIRIDGKVIPLAVEPRWLTVEPGDLSLETVRSIVQPTSIEVDSVQNHFGVGLVWLGAGRSTFGAESAAMRLRRDFRVTFASAAYWEPARPLYRDCPRLLIDRFVVSVLGGANAERELAALNATTGATIERRDYWYVLRYPRMTELTPLDLVEHYARQAFVVWASPDGVELLPGCASVTQER